MLSLHHRIFNYVFVCFEFLYSIGCSAPCGLHESDPPLGSGHPDGGVGTEPGHLRADAPGREHAVMLEE